MRLLVITALAALVVALAPRTPPEPRAGLVARPGVPTLDPCAPLRFVVLGDGRAGLPGVGPSAYKRAILGEAIARAPAFIADTGDLVEDGEDPAQWPRLLETLPARTPYVAVRGNHDVGGFYTWRLAPAPVFAHRVGPVLVVGLDTEGRHDADVRARVAEVDAALTADDAAWKVLVMHRPVWSHGPHGSDERDLNRVLVPVLDRHRVAVVFSGHDHDYERLCASVGHGADRRCDPGGTHYVVTGGAATFTSHWPTGDAAGTSRHFSGSRHFVEVEVSGAEMTLTARRTLAGNVRPPGVVDRVVVRRPGPCG